MQALRVVLLYLSVDKERFFFLAFMAFKVKLTKMAYVQGNGPRFQVKNINPQSTFNTTEVIIYFIIYLLLFLIVLLFFF